MPCALAHSRTSVGSTALPAPCVQPGLPPTTDACPPGGAHVARQRASQLLGRLRAQIDLVLRAVQPEADGTVCVTAIKVIHHLDLYRLSRKCLLLSRAWRISLAKFSRWAQPLQSDAALPCRAGRWAPSTSLTSVWLRSQRAAATFAPRDGPVVTVRKWHLARHASQAAAPNGLTDRPGLCQRLDLCEDLDHCGLLCAATGRHAEAATVWAA